MSAEELPLIETAELPSVAETRPEGLMLASVSRDGRRMLFVDASGREFTVDVDDRLRAALPADAPRRQETPVTTSLRPKDIQTRIRGGESAEDVAASAGTTVEKIMPFAGPVLAERDHMAARAQKGTVRRRAGEPAGTARTLGDAVSQRLSAFYLKADEVVWDSWRRPDGRWALLGSYETPERSGTAEMVFDAAGNYVSLENDDARWLVGEPLHEPAPEPFADELGEARLRRASAPAAPLAPVEEPVVAPEADPAAVVPAADTETVEPVEAPVEPVAEQPQPKSSRRKRASVPSWDEIMFGGGKPE